MSFVERSKSGSTNVVIFKYSAIFYWLMWPTFVVSCLAYMSSWSLLVILAVVMWIVLIGSAAPYWPTMAELKKVMREKGIKGSGSKYSLSNPLRYEWED
jgi:hypothetical protein